jgi:glyoxylate reductase
MRRMNQPSLPKTTVGLPFDDHLTVMINNATNATWVDFRAPREELLAKIADAEGILVSNMVKANAELFDAAPKLRVLSGVGVGYNNADVPEATRRGIAICNTPGVLTNAVADLTIAMILMLSKRLKENEEYVRSGGWARRDPMPPLGFDLRGKMLGVVGFGRIGREVTRRAQAFGMKTAFYDLFDLPVVDAPPSTYRPLDDLLGESDIVSLHVNLDQSTHHMIGARELSLMRPDAYLVNTSRGPVVDQEALTTALQAGAIAGAALDVLEQEPPDADDPIVRLPNVLCFPHMATATHETRLAMRELAVRNLLAVLAGKAPPACVNPRVLPGLGIE